MVMRPVEGSYLPLRSYPMAMPFQQNAVARCLNHDAAGTLAVVDEAAVGGYVVLPTIEAGAAPLAAALGMVAFELGE